MSFEAGWSRLGSGHGQHCYREEIVPAEMAVGLRSSSRMSATVIDLFAGCGGLSLGLELAGFRPVYVNELGMDAMATYLLNRLRDYPELAKAHSYDIFDV